MAQNGFQCADFDGGNLTTDSLLPEATNMVSKNCPIIGEDYFYDFYYTILWATIAMV